MVSSSDTETIRQATASIDRLRRAVASQSARLFAHFLEKGSCPLRLYVPICPGCDRSMGNAATLSTVQLPGLAHLVWVCGKCNREVRRPYFIRPPGTVYVWVTALAFFELGNGPKGLPPLPRY